MEGLHIVEQNGERYLCYEAGGYRFGGDIIPEDGQQVSQMLRKLANEISPQVLKAFPVTEINDLALFLSKYEEGPKVRYRDDYSAMQRDAISELLAAVTVVRLQLEEWVK